MTLARLYVLLDLNSGPFRAGMLSAIAQIGIFQKSMMGLTTGQTMTNIGRGLTTGLTIPLIAGAAAIGVIGSQLTTEMARVQSVIATPGNTRDGLIAHWTDDVQALGVTLGRTSPEVAGGLYEIVSAFGDLANATEFLEIAARAAVAGQSDIVTSTKNLVLASRAWGDSSTQGVQDMADLMSATVRVGTVTESELGPAMAGLLPIMKLYGVELGEGFAGLATLAGVSGSASQASTQLQRAITSLVAPNTTLTKLYKQNGIASGEALIQNLGLVGAFKEIKRISEETGTPLQKMLGRIEGLKAVATLTGPQLVKFGENLTAMGLAAGDVDRAFAGATEGIGNAEFEWGRAFQRVRVTFEDLYIALGPAALNVANSLAPIGEGLAGIASAVGDIDTDTLTNIVGALLGLAVLGPTLTILGGIAQGFTTLRIIAVALWGPVGLVAAAFTTLWIAYDQNWLGAKDKVAAGWQWILDNAPNVRRELDQLKAAIGEIANPSLPEGPGDQMPGLFQRYGQAQKEFYDVLKGVWATIGDQSAQFQARIQATVTNVSAMWNSLKTTVSTVVQAIIQSIMGVSIGIMGMTLGVGAAFVGLVGFFTSAAQGVSALVAGMKTGFTNAVSAARAGVANIKSAFTGAGWVSIGSSIISGITAGIRGAAGSLASAAASAAKAALSAAKSALGINSPSSVFRDQVGKMIPAGMALGVYDAAGLVNRAINSLSLGGSSGQYNIGVSGGGGGFALAGAGAGGSTTHTTEITFGDIIVNGGSGEAGAVVVDSITKALRSRGLL